MLVCHARHDLDPTQLKRRTQAEETKAWIEAPPPPRCSKLYGKTPWHKVLSLRGSSFFGWGEALPPKATNDPNSSPAYSWMVGGAPGA